MIFKSFNFNLKPCVVFFLTIAVSEICNGYKIKYVFENTNAYVYRYVCTYICMYMCMYVLYMCVLYTQTIHTHAYNTSIFFFFLNREIHVAQAGL